MADHPPEKKVKRRVPFHTGHVGDGTPVKDTRDQKGRKKPPRRAKQTGRSKLPSQRGKKGTVGRPRFALTKEMKTKIVEAVGLGMNEEQTAAYAHINPRTWALHREKILHQTQALCAAEFADNELKVRKSLLTRAKAGEIAHIQFAAKWLFKYVEAKRTELTGAGGGPVATTQSSEFSNDEIIARLQTLVDDVNTRQTAPRERAKAS